MCCHGEHSGDAQSHSGRGGVHVYPEGDPGKNDNEEGGDIHLDQVVAHLPLQVEAHLNTSKFTCSKREAAQISSPISKQLFAVFTLSFALLVQSTSVEGTYFCTLGGKALFSDIPALPRAKIALRDEECQSVNMSEIRS